MCVTLLHYGNDVSLCQLVAYSHDLEHASYSPTNLVEKSKIMVSPTRSHHVKVASLHAGRRSRQGLSIIIPAYIQGHSC
jgi:hypothetical protein